VKVEFDESGFAIAGGVHAAVLEVFAYKEDLFSFDVLCFGFRTSGDGSFWTVGEDYDGYQELLVQLPLRFPGIRTDWFSEVAFPAFATNRTTLWGRPLPD
jgi:hypothetical protein